MSGAAVKTERFSELVFSKQDYDTIVFPRGITVAFHGKQSLKAHYLDKVAKRINSGYTIYSADGKNNVRLITGTTVDSEDFAVYEKELGIPRTVAILNHYLFKEILSEKRKDAQSFAIKFLESIKPGADLSLVYPKFAHWMLVGPKYGVTNYVNPTYFGVKRAINKVADVLGRLVTTGVIDRSEVKGLCDITDNASHQTSAWFPGEGTACAAGDTAWRITQTLAKLSGLDTHPQSLEEHIHFSIWGMDDVANRTHQIPIISSLSLNPLKTIKELKVIYGGTRKIQRAKLLDLLKEAPQV